MKTLREFNIRTVYAWYPQQVILVGVRGPDYDNLMPAVWHTKLSFDPPLYGVSIAPQRATHGMVEARGEFTISLLPHSDAGLVERLGSVSGADVDKLSELGVEKVDAATVDAPIPASAYLSFECRLANAIAAGDHTLFVGCVTALRYRPELCEPRNGGLVLKSDALPLLYAGEGGYCTSDPATLRTLRR